MPGTRRTPINRQHKPPVSELAIRLFMKMQRCRNCDRWWDLHTELRREVGAKLWERPCIEDPHAGNPEKPGTYSAGSRTRRHGRDGARSSKVPVSCGAVSARCDGLLRPFPSTSPHEPDCPHRHAVT